MPSLSRVAAAERAALLTVESYDIELDLTGGAVGFRSTTQVRFRCATPGATTFVEVRPSRLLRVRLNGADVDPAAREDNQVTLTGLLADNTLVVEAQMAYSNSGEGLHRFVDPADGHTYLYAMSGMDNAQRIFACFDQPDLKAPVTLSVVAPPDWTVVGNGEPAAAPAPRSTPGETGLTWRFLPTPPLATYFVTLIAGPYHVLRAEHDGIPLGVYCRRSLAEHLDRDAEEILTVTRQCLDRLHELFELRYPFGKYDQAFVPEFNMGAMENPGLVVLRDDHVHRSAVTEGERENRASTIAHEMAHMWFGDLVTLRWWDDLWLNESFAEYFGTRVTAEATRFDWAWTTFGLRRKAWGYAADQRPSTHPVAPSEVVDAGEALSNLDGISYAKGAAVLRQLVAWLGDEAFLAGLRAYFTTHRFGNATLADLLAALSASSGRDLTGWAEVWLRQPRVNTLRAEVRLRDDGRYAEVAVVQSAPPEHPVLRPHRIGVGLYDLDLDPGAEGGGPGVRLRDRIEVDLDPTVDRGRTVLDGLAGQPAARLLLPNDGDLTFAKVRLDAASAAAVPSALPDLADPLARALLWAEALDAVTDGERPVSDLVALIVAALPAEVEAIVVQDVLTRARSLLDRYLDPDVRSAAWEQVAGACDRLLAVAPPGGSRQLAAVRGLIGATVDTARLTGWLVGRHVPEGLAVDAELRWAVLHRLAVLGAMGEPEIAAEQDADRSASGAERAAKCRAALPDPAAKDRAWQIVTRDTTASNRLVEANAAGFWQPEQAELTSPYVERYFTEMPEAARSRTPWVADRVAALGYPRYAVSGRTRELAAALLTRDDLPAGLRRVVTDADDDLRRALAARVAAG